MNDRPDLALRRLQVDTYLTLARIRGGLERRATALFAETELDVTPAQSNVLLLLLHGREPATARQLAERLGCSEVTVGRFVKALEERDWVERTPHPSDGRAMLVQPTAKARESMPKLIALANTLLDEAFAGLEKAEIEALAAVAERIRDNLTR
ncbi:MAG: MarR family transcriptional regulator [Myxococcales bacterium]|nr:MarR family transcriptional regulator [Myxococcales bacterium]